MWLKRYALAPLLFLVGYCLQRWEFTTYLHELGHALAGLILTGYGEVAGSRLAYVGRTGSPVVSWVIDTGGVGFEILAGCLLTVLLARSRRPWLAGLPFGLAHSAVLDPMQDLYDFVRMGAVGWTFWWAFVWACLGLTWWQVVRRWRKRRPA